jgi:hypothetical protein
MNKRNASGNLKRGGAHEHHEHQLIWKKTINTRNALVASREEKLMNIITTIE